ncbi:MAG TPA: tyrosine-type recombinase/integrase [Sphingobium sp.]|uniref:tyrosine-type recombinase/integrase n=1 Tax=Sphingobium sp. TaxID=1912891 RepID=UPI002ED4773C
MSDVEGLHFVKAVRPGKPVRWYVYAWRGGPRVLTSESPTRPKLNKEQLGDLLAALPAKDDGTIASLIRRLRGVGSGLEKASPEWKALAPTTRETWGFALDAIEKKWGKTPIAVWNDYRMVAKVIEWRDSRSNTPRAADMGVTALSFLLSWAKLRAIIKMNVAEDVPAIYSGGDRAEIIWTQQDIDAFYQATERKLHIRDILDLATTTGLRRSDLAAVTFDEVGDHAIIRVAQKKSRGKRRRAVIPLTDQSRAVIATLRSRPRAEGVKTLLVNSLGGPWTPGSLTQAFNTVRDEANKGKGIIHPGSQALETVDRKKHLHDCRGTFVTQLCRAGLSDEDIAKVVAWSPENVARVRRLYVDDANVVIALAERIAAAQRQRA